MAPLGLSLWAISIKDLFVFNQIAFTKKALRNEEPFPKNQFNTLLTRLGISDNVKNA